MLETAWKDRAQALIPLPLPPPFQPIQASSCTTRGIMYMWCVLVSFVQIPHKQPVLGYA